MPKDVHVLNLIFQQCAVTVPRKETYLKNIIQVLYQKLQGKTKGTSTFELSISIMIYDVMISNYQSIYK